MEQDSSSLEEPLVGQFNRNVTPFENSNLLSRLTFSWLNPLLKLGYARPLKVSDVAKLSENDSAEAVHGEFTRALESQKSHRKRVAFALIKCHWKVASLTGALALVRTLAVSSGPVFLYVFVDIISKSQQQGVGGTPGAHSRSHAFLLILGLTLSKVAQSLAQRHWSFESRHLGVRIRSSIMAAVYSKELKLSSMGKQRHAAGEIVSYIGVDAYRLGEFSWWLHYSWASLIQIILALVVLFNTVNYAALACVLVMALTMVGQVPISRALQKSQNNLMIAQDERLRRTAEVLNSIKIIKLQAWEEEFKHMVEARRSEEMDWLSSMHDKRTKVGIVFWLSYASAISLTLLSFVLLGNELNAAIIFTVFSAFSNTQEPVRLVPDVLATISQVMVSMQRLDVFLNDDELPNDTVMCRPSEVEHAIRVECGSFSWDEGKTTLTGIDMEIKRGEKVAVCGAVGSGKSSLLCAILGEIPKLASSTVQVNGSVAYVSQTAWIQGGSIRDNILFGRSMDQVKLSAAIRACALDKDLEMFPHGDLTEIGERGLNLSGGQKQRIQLARAVYNDADIYLLDDPFSAVDAHTSATLFHECIMKALSRKTVVLVTHQVEFLPALDCIVVMQAGKIEQLGTYEQLLQTGLALNKLVNAHYDTFNSASNNNSTDPTQESLPRIGSKAEHSYQRSLSAGGNKQQASTIMAQLTEEEVKETTDLGLQPYKDYLSISKGSLIFITELLLQVGLVAGQITGGLWLAIQVTKTTVNSSYTAYGYVIIAYATSLFLISRVRVHRALALRASRAFFTGFMESLFRAPMSFFDSTPTGRILSRAANDMNLLDVDIYQVGNTLVAFMFDFPGVLVVLGVVMWQALIIIIPMLLVIRRIESYYRSSAQVLMRLSAMTKAPIVNFSGETISGAMTIRAFKMQERFKKRNMGLIDTDSALYFHTNGVMEWLILRVEACGTLMLCIFGLSLAAIPNISSGLAGVGLAYALTINVSLVIITQWYCQMASHIVSVERIKQYMHIPVEPPAVIESNRPPPEWPSRGKIVLKNLQIKYRPNTPLVLRGITCSFEGGEKVGIVGRTGSGKSTLTGAIFRLVDPAAGKILIDDIDICSIGLHDLRSKLGIIPQEPTLFRGTVRTNLDPLGKYRDQEIWEALDKCQMGKEIRSMSSQLESSVTDEGGNWSAGQRQLFCLGRVLLKRTRILVLDEATASIDSSTDAILQRVIREEFAQCTVITVAHRIPTVIDSNRVLALQDGLVAEYQSPERLLEDKNSLFSKLVAEYWAERSH